MRRIIACLLGACAGVTLLHAQAPGRSEPPSIITAPSPLERFLAEADASLTSYRAFRTLEAEAFGGRMRARLTAWTSLDAQRGFQYEVVDEDGSKLIRNKVLRAALEAERSMRANGDVNRGALVPANYEFTLDPSSDPDMVRIRIHPRRVDTILLDGSIVLTGEGDLVRVEGLLIKRPSFWTRRVEITRHYARVLGVRVPLSMQSTANVMMAGASTFAMTYEYASINGVAVPRASHPVE